MNDNFVLIQNILISSLQNHGGWDNSPLSPKKATDLPLLQIEESGTKA